MNNKMAINTYLSTIESKKETKQNKQVEQKQNRRQRTFQWLPDGRGFGRKGKKGERIKKYKQQLQNIMGM